MIRKIKNSSASFILSSSLLILSACNEPGIQQATPGGGGVTKTSPTPTPKPTSTPRPTATPISGGDQGTGGVKVVIRQSTNFTTKGLSLLEGARTILEKVLNSEEFKQRVLHFTYQGAETFVQNDGLTNLQIYNQIMGGAEQYPKATAVDHTVDLYAELYHGGSGVIGYTDPSTSTIYMNSYYYNYYTASEVVGNMLHEWLHKLGYDHDYNSTARRPSSVPYAIGYIAEELAEKY